MNLSSQHDFEKCINPFSIKLLKNGSYDLSIKKIIDSDGKEHFDYKVKPQGVVYVIFNERIDLPLDVIGFAHVKTSLTKKGLLSTNIGIIDPEYNGYISTLLINFGKVDYMLSAGDPALRITLTKLANKAMLTKSKTNVKSDTEAEYITQVKRDMTALDEKFLNLSALKRDLTSEVKKEVFGTMRNYVGLLTLTSVIIGICAFLYNLSKDNNQSTAKESIAVKEMQWIKEEIDSIKILMKASNNTKDVIKIENTKNSRK